MNEGNKAVLRTLYNFCKENGFNHPHMIIAEELLTVKQSDLSIEKISKVVSRYFNMSFDTLKKKSRKREIVQARQIAMYFSYVLGQEFGFNWSLATIGAEIGDKDHATVLHAIKTVRNLKETSRQYNHNIVDIEINLRSLYRKKDEHLQQMET